MPVVFIDLTGAGSMNHKGPKPVALVALLLSSAIVFSVQIAAAQTSASPSTTASRPAKTPAEQTSEPNAAPPATTTQTTGESNRDATAEKMNQDAKQKVETEGK
jgi:hypothetical protein